MFKPQVQPWVKRIVSQKIERPFEINCRCFGELEKSCHLLEQAPFEVQQLSLIVKWDLH